MGNSFKEAAEKKRLEAERRKAEEEKRRLEAEQESGDSSETDSESADEPETTQELVSEVASVDAPSEPSEDVGGVNIESLIGPAKKTAKGRKKTVAVYFSEENHKWLKKQADLRGKSVSAVLDEIISKLRN